MLMFFADALISYLILRLSIVSVKETEHAVETSSIFMDTDENCSLLN